MLGDTYRWYLSVLKEWAVRMVAENVGEHESEWVAMTRVAELLGVGTPEAVRKWGPSGTGRRGRPGRGSRVRSRLGSLG